MLLRLARRYPRQVAKNPALALVALEDPLLYARVREEIAFSRWEGRVRAVEVALPWVLAPSPGAIVLAALAYVAGLLPGERFLLIVLGALLWLLPAVAVLLGAHHLAARRLARLRERPATRGGPRQ